jgi:hypothetical protein
VLPSFSRKYRLRTVPKSNSRGRWYGLRFEDLGFVTLPEYEAAKALADVIERGARRIEAPIADQNPGPAAA